jgi:type I restriction enzyme M protein
VEKPEARLFRKAWLLLPGSATLAEIAAHDYVLTPGRYVGAADVDDDDELFEEKMERLTSTLLDQFDEAMNLTNIIRQNLQKVGYGE